MEHSFTLLSSLSSRHTITGLILLTILIGCTQTKTDAPPVTTIEMDATGFHGEPITIKKGDRVCWKNIDPSDGHWPASNIHPTHEIYPEFDPKRPVPPGESWCFTFDKAGIWRFHDHLFPEFSGVVTVTDDGN